MSNPLRFRDYEYELSPRHECEALELIELLNTSSAIWWSRVLKARHIFDELTRTKYLLGHEDWKDTSNIEELEYLCAQRNKADWELIELTRQHWFRESLHNQALSGSISYAKALSLIREKAPIDKAYYHLANQKLEQWAKNGELLILQRVNRELPFLHLVAPAVWFKKKSLWN